MLFVIVPEGERRVVPDTGEIVKDIPLLHDPEPAAFLVCNHHWAAPDESTVVGFTEQVPMPLAHHRYSAVYHFMILLPVE